MQLMNENNDPLVLAHAKRVLHIEAQAVLTLADKLDNRFVEACMLIYHTRGRVVVTGMGKSGHVGKKIAATLASTGTPAFFVHPAEAVHGDLGMITPEDVVLALSHSGESDEVLSMLPSLKRKGVAIIAVTGRLSSTLAQQATVHINAAIDKEACPMNLAPTASTTAVMALGDALAVALLEKRGFKSEDFALSHPAGALGRRLLVRVGDVMRKGEALPTVTDQTLIRDALLEISRKGMGMTAVLNLAGDIIGVFTDGDLRRALDSEIDIHTSTVNEVMTAHPHCIDADRLAVEAVQLMESVRITGIFVTQDNALVGALNMHDLLRAKII
jgi:arabinose-5-phosphate isomerase